MKLVQQTDTAFWEQFGDVFFNDEKWSRAGVEALKLSQLMGLTAGSRILDLCCGAGRHSIELSKLGFDVTGVDFSAHLLSEAGRRARKQGVEVELVQADARDFRRRGAFAGVIMLGSAFGYFDDPAENRRILLTAADCLMPSGVLFMKLVSKELVLRSYFRGENLGGPTMGGDKSNLRIRIRDNFERVEMCFGDSSSGAVPRQSFTHRLYSATAMLEVLKDCGFGQISVFGDYDGGPYNEDAVRLILVARRL